VDMDVGLRGLSLLFSPYSIRATFGDCGGNFFPPIFLLFSYITHFRDFKIYHLPSCPHKKFPLA
jgi:hypothetical protein